MKWYGLICNREHRQLYQDIIDTFKGVLNFGTPGQLLVSSVNDKYARSSRHSCAITCASTPLVQETSKFLDIKWHRPVGNLLDLF